MKISKTKLRQIIKEELEFVGAEIEDAPEPPEDVEEPGLGLGTPEETLLTLMRAREILDQFGSFEELAAAIPAIEQDQDTARWVAAIKANPMYAKTQSVTSTGPWSPEKRDTELEEYRSTGTGGQSAKDREKPARPSSDTRSSSQPNVREYLK